MPNLKAIICLHKTSHPGNIGSVARAMKTMGLDDLRLIDCCDYQVSEAYAMACGADDVLFKARIYDSLPEALSDCHHVYGLSARARTTRRSIISSPDLPAMLTEMSKGQTIGFLFGNESHGLDNAALALCHSQIMIPTNPGYHSLNLAQAVQIVCYLFATTVLDKDHVDDITSTSLPSTHAKHHAILLRLTELLKGSKFSMRQNPDITIQKLWQIFLRAQLNDDEADLVCGILKQLSQTDH